METALLDCPLYRKFKYSGGLNYVNAICHDKTPTEYFKTHLQASLKWFVFSPHTVHELISWNLHVPFQQDFCVPSRQRQQAPTRLFYAKNAPVTSISICLDFVQAFLEGFFTAPNLSSHQIELLRVFIRAMSLFDSVKSGTLRIPRVDGALHMKDTATPPHPRIPPPRCHMESAGDKSFFCSSGARANRSARLFPSPDNEPQPWVKGDHLWGNSSINSLFILQGLWWSCQEGAN